MTQISPAPRHPGARPDCRSCGGEGFVVTHESEVAVARHCSCVARCPDCGDTGLVAVAPTFRAARRRCTCKLVEQRMASFDAASIPARHATSTRASFVPSSQHQTAVLGAVSRWLATWQPGSERGLILYGDVGRGKTHLLVAMLRELVLVRGTAVRFVEFSHLLADLKAGFDAGRGAAALLDPLVAVEVLAIDELGKGRHTEFESMVVDELVSRRYNAMRPILATTNFLPHSGTGRAVVGAAEAGLGMAAPPSLVDRVGERVFSRLRETCDFVEVKGEDYRAQPRRSAAPAARVR
jgi:DNA replication protein DnaC